ncbi:hypothetical protein [Thermodesulfovibrio sp. Kuro-1]|uniref:hypothetical protein n=1 Tax=Thermodesulfovibrio sp. Kuro-1 TaxID=2580394 RepID=UPI0015E8546E|nr:hypothetical protein [Thermodesulfovibrio sp. Kuro-1]
MKGCKIDIQSVKNYLLEKNERKLALKRKEQYEILSMVRRLSKLWENMKWKGFTFMVQW